MDAQTLINLLALHLNETTMERDILRKQHAVILKRIAELEQSNTEAPNAE